MKPVYQGQVDVFCAAYAVINAMRFMHETRLLACRELLHEALRDAVQDPEHFEAILQQQTDYVDWVDAMLRRLRIKGLLSVDIPFPCSYPGPESVSAETIWTKLEQWLESDARRTAIFQFIRHIIPGKVIIRHWTCARPICGTTMPLLDCSLEPGAVQRIERNSLITDEAQGVCNKILIVPYTIRLLGPTGLVPVSGELQ